MTDEVFEKRLEDIYETVIKEILINDFQEEIGEGDLKTKPEWLKPPFDIWEEHKEKNLTDHVNITIKSSYNYNHHDKFLPRTGCLTVNKRNIEDLTSDYEYGREDRFVKNEGFSDLLRAVATPDYGSIVTLDKTEEDYKMDFFNAKIDNVHRDCKEGLKKKIDKEGLKRPKRNENENQYNTYMKKLVNKIYEMCGGSSATGEKHFATGYLIQEFTNTKIAADIMSTTGIYTRIRRDPVNDKDEDWGEVNGLEVNNTAILNVEDIPGDIEDEDYILENNDEEYVILSVEYERNNRFDVDSNWLDVSKEYIIRPDEIFREKLKLNKSIVS